MDVNARSYRWSESRSKVCQMFNSGEDETLEHVMLECVKYARDRAADPKARPERDPESPVVSRSRSRRVSDVNTASKKWRATSGRALTSKWLSSSCVFQLRLRGVFGSDLLWYMWWMGLQFAAALHSLVSPSTRDTPAHTWNCTTNGRKQDSTSHTLQVNPQAL
ncbi:hypothetical protein E2C01_067488 [Portunus trituberculatus]|uniref:Uncharacterized protein n=1 Tax=Portunus trituberculatus TaxID=210409 RepID=A0A5B7HL52_PORTR|nr:hypothetical protein [Portunus trituberculatus]